MSDIAAYLAEIEWALISSPVIVEYHVVHSWANTDDGYIRIRARLTNDDFLEAAEHFVLQEGQIVTTDYRHQWMSGDKSALRRRWDSTPDHPELANFPHHVHIGDERTVLPSRPMSLIDLLRMIENELCPE